MMEGEPANLSDPDAVIALFHAAARAMREHPLRQGSTIELPRQGRLLVSGDLHDHTFNFRRIVELARLEASPEHYVLLQELIHGSSPVNGCDLSVRMLAEAAHLIVRFPQQVLVLLSNHEMAQVAGRGIMKAGGNLVAAFDRGLGFLYHQRAGAVREAMAELVWSLPMAVRCANGVLCAHSLPSPGRMAGFDPGVLDRPVQPEDWQRGGACWEMVWGRHQQQEQARELARAWAVQQFVLGHQPADRGYRTEGERIMILASDHDRGMALPMDLAQTYDQQALIAALVPLHG